MIHAYLQYVSGDAGLLVVNEIHNDRDKNRPGQRFNASEMAWQSFLLGVEQDGVQPSRLRCIVISHIINENTKNVIFEIFETTRVRRGQIETLCITTPQSYNIVQIGVRKQFTVWNLPDLSRKLTYIPI